MVIAPLRKLIASNVQLSGQRSVKQALFGGSSALSQDQIGNLRARLATAGDQLYRMLAALEWASNQGNAIAFAEDALGGSRLNMLQGLLQRLDSLGFQGVLRLETHLGRFLSRR